MNLIAPRFAEELNEKEMRDAYLSAQTRTYVAYQIRANRITRNWSQEEFASILHTSQSAVSRMEDRQYGKLNLQSLFDLASAFDCGLSIKFVPYAEFIRQTNDLSRENLAVPEFDPASLRPLVQQPPFVEEQSEIVFLQNIQYSPPISIALGVSPNSVGWPGTPTTGQQREKDSEIALLKSEIALLKSELEAANENQKLKEGLSAQARSLQEFTQLAAINFARSNNRQLQGPWS